MNVHAESSSLSREDVKEKFGEFMESMSVMDGLLSEENTSEEVERIEEEMDSVFSIIETSYCEFMGEGGVIPENYNDIGYVIGEEAECSGFTNDEIWNVFHTVHENHPDEHARVVWWKVLERLEEKRRIERIENGNPTTTVSDWR